MRSGNGFGPRTAEDAPPHTEHAYIDRSALGYLEADTAQLERAAVNRLRAREATLTQSAIAFGSAETLTIRQSSAGVIIGRSVACDEVRTVLLASPVVRGEVHTLVDLRTAVAIGLGMAAGKALLSGGRAIVRRVLR